MATNNLLAVCPNCGWTFDLEQAWQDADGRRFIAVLTSLPESTIRPLYNYIRLFKPPKQALRWSRILAIAEELAPLIKAAELSRNKISYRVPAKDWAAAMTYLVETPPSTLTKPLKSNGYLLSILADRAEKAVALQTEQAATVKQAEKQQANQAVAKAKQAVNDSKKPAEINPVFKQKLMEALTVAKQTVLTPEQKAEQLARLDELKEKARQEEASYSAEQKAELDNQRAQRRDFEQSINPEIIL
jgi:hypothetical protein